MEPVLLVGRLSAHLRPRRLPHRQRLLRLPGLLRAGLRPRPQRGRRTRREQHRLLLLAGGRQPGRRQSRHIRIALPADAEVRFDGDKTTQTGAHRAYVSPPLQPGHEYSYEVKAQWKENGREVTRDRRITVHAGDVVNVSFMEVQKEKSK